MELFRNRYRKGGGGMCHVTSISIHCGRQYISKTSLHGSMHVSLVCANVHNIAHNNAQHNIQYNHI